MSCALAWEWTGRVVRVGLGLVCPQEEESPCGEVTLKRDRSFSEHDLVQLRSEALAGLQPATQPAGGSAPPRARAGSAHTPRPCAQEPGKCRPPRPPRHCPVGAGPLASPAGGTQRVQSSSCTRVSNVQAQTAPSPRAGAPHCYNLKASLLDAESVLTVNIF